jgi:molybdopterin-guanine dinucleotide biosynthesis protein A
MGSDKALVELHRRPMIDHVSQALNAAGLEVLVVGRETAPKGLAAISDIAGLGGGPAVGLLTAFDHVDTGDVFLVAVDQPLLQPKTIERLLDIPGDAVVPQANGHPQVTCALYRRSCHQPLADLLASGKMKLRHLLTVIEASSVDETLWSSWGEDGRSWLSLDTPQAVLDAEALP